MKRLLWITIAVMACLCVGYTARSFQEDALMYWYPLLEKSSFTPPDRVFPIAWGIIYVCMGISVGMLCKVNTIRRFPLLMLFVIQLMLNFLWSISFFYMQNPLLGLINIVLLDIAVLVYTIRTHYVKRLSAWLFYPYILWLVLATYLNAYVYIAN